MQSDLQGKIVIITGASSGIGKACAIKFAASGAKVVLASRNEIRINAVAKSIVENKHEAVIFVCDVTIESDCKNLIDKTIQKFGKIDVLVCNAGISMRSLFVDVDLNVIRKLMDTNFWGAVYCTKYALPWLLKSHGSVVAVSSIAGKKGLPGRTGYSASKFALEGFMETLRTENLRNNLHVLVACPNFTESEIRNNALSFDGTPQGDSPLDEEKLMSAEEVANEILVAVKNRRRDLILTRQGKLAVLLNKFFPAWLDKLIYNHISKEKGSPFK